jgi:hypothetical protein
MSRTLTVLARLASLILAIGASGSALRAQSAEPAAAPATSLAVRPAWEETLTARLELLADSVDSPAAALAAPAGEPYATAMSRSRRLERLGRQDQPLWWRVTLRAPASAEQGWPLALEVDESRVITGAWLDGEPLPGFSGARRGEVWNSGEGWLVLPRASGVLTLRAAPLPHLYENGFGQLRLRPAELVELLDVARPAADATGLTVRNTGPVALSGVLHHRHEDYFGVALGEGRAPFRLAPGESATLPVPPAARSAEPLYKTRHWLVSGERATPEYWRHFDAIRDLRARPLVHVPENRAADWTYVFIPGPHASNPPPREGWKPLPGLPFRPQGPAYESHWFWARRTVRVPADWPRDRRVALLAPARHVRVNGEVLADLPPGGLALEPLLLPASIRPGDSFELLIGVTDYIDSLVDPASAPRSGPMQPVLRGVNGPVVTTGAMAMEFNIGLELASVPAVHTRWVRVGTTFAEGGRISAEVEVANASASAAELTVHAAVLERGRVVRTLPPVPVAVPAGGVAPVALAAPFTDARPWHPDSPHLYELRVELRRRSGPPLDTHRSRFGFREFGVEGEHFTLNGARIHLLGGSHTDLLRLTWPLTGHPYRLVRYLTPGNTGPTFVGGQARSNHSTNIADEAGYILKSEPGNLNAHGSDYYAWHRPEMWERLEGRMHAFMRAYPNHPSIVMWDIGNEISYRGPGEDEKMGALFNRLEKLDPARLATTGGPASLPVGSTTLNTHAWGNWNDLADYWFYHPEKRPSYLREIGTYSRRPAGEPAGKWTHHDRGSVPSTGLLGPGASRGLRHLDGKPMLFAEGHYYESRLPYPLFGHDVFLPTPDHVRATGHALHMADHGLNNLATRTRSVQNVRRAGVAASMIHVDRGVGRNILPLAAFNVERRARFFADRPVELAYAVHQDLTAPATVLARFRLHDGERLLGERLARWPDLAPASVREVALSFPPPPGVTEPRALRLEVRVWTENGPGWFQDDVALTVFPRAELRLPAGQRLAVFDPLGSVAPVLAAAGVKFLALDDLAAWQPEPDLALLVGSAGLAEVSPAALGDLADKIHRGGRAIVLEHSTIPQFLRTRLTQAYDFMTHAARLDGPSPVTEGLLTSDFHAWQTGERDQVVVRNAPEVPATGLVRPHLTAGRRSPVLEIGEGSGRVLLVQLNLRDALPHEPAARRVLANLLAWTGAPAPWPRVPTLLVGADPAFVGGMKNRLGLVATTREQPAEAELRAARLIVAKGSDAASREALLRVGPALRAHLREGATLFLQDLDEAGARWVSQLVAGPVEIAPFRHRHAMVVEAGSPLMAGLGHGDFFISDLGRQIERYRPVGANEPATALAVVRGAAVRPLTRPAYVAEIPLGRGRVVVSMLSVFERPVPSQVRALSALLSNAGATLDLEAAAAGEGEASWLFRPVDLSSVVNRPLARGEADDALRAFPAGRQTLRGVEHQIAPPRGEAGDSVIGVAARPPGKVEDIAVNAKAERIHFLHTGVGGAPVLVYRVWYKEDRARWIPGQADPFVDVLVRPGQHYADGTLAGQVERGERFMPATRVAWLSAGKPEFGVFETVWDNPHPEKTIGTIDVFARPDAGEGEAIVLGLSLASRDPSAGGGGATAEPLPLSRVLPGVSADQVEAEVRFSRYGFVLLKDGLLGVVYDREGRPLGSGGDGWAAQASGDGLPRRHLGVQRGSRPTITRLSRPGREEFLVEGRNEHLVWESRFIATAASLRQEFKFAALKALPEGYDPRLTLPLQFGRDVKLEGPSVNANPVMLRTPGGSATLQLDQRNIRWVFNHFVDDNSLRYHMPTRLSATDRQSRWNVDEWHSVWWELSPP